MTYVIAALGVFFVARTVTMMDGPFGLCALLREKIDPQQTTWLGRGMNCPICVGFYVAFVIAWLVPWIAWQDFVLTWLGLAGANAVLHILVENMVIAEVR